MDCSVCVVIPMSGRLDIVAEAGKRCREGTHSAGLVLVTCGPTRRNGPERTVTDPQPNRSVPVFHAGEGTKVAALAPTLRDRYQRQIPEAWHLNLWRTAGEDTQQPLEFGKIAGGSGVKVEVLQEDAILTCGGTFPLRR